MADYDRELIADMLEKYMDVLAANTTDNAGHYPIGTIVEQIELLTSTPGSAAHGGVLRFLQSFHRGDFGAHEYATVKLAGELIEVLTTPIADASKPRQVEAVAWQARLRGVDSEWQSISQPAYDEIVLNELWEKRALYLGPAPNAASLMPEDVDKLARELLADEYSLVGDDRVAGRIRRGNAFQDERIALRAITAAALAAAPA